MLLRSWLNVVWSLNGAANSLYVTNPFQDMHDCNFRRALLFGSALKLKRVKKWKVPTNIIQILFLRLVHSSVKKYFACLKMDLIFAHFYVAQSFHFNIGKCGALKLNRKCAKIDFVIPKQANLIFHFNIGKMERDQWEMQWLCSFIGSFNFWIFFFF